MHISRLFSLVSTRTLSQLSGRVAPFLWAPCRTITTGQDYVNFGRKKKVKVVDVTRKLDPFLGYWVSDPKRGLQEYGQYMSEENITELKRWEQEEHQQYYSFFRNNGDWTVTLGDQGERVTITYTFNLGRMFLYAHKDIAVVKCTIIQDVSGMIWVHKILTQPEQIYSTHMMVKDRKLLCNKVNPDGSFGFKVYYKQL